jgi:hypothetical protein
MIGVAPVDYTKLIFLISLMYLENHESYEYSGQSALSSLPVTHFISELSPF